MRSKAEDNTAPNPQRLPRAPPARGWQRSAASGGTGQRPHAQSPEHLRAQRNHLDARRLQQDVKAHDDGHDQHQAEGESFAYVLVAGDHVAVEEAADLQRASGPGSRRSRASAVA